MGCPRFKNRYRIRSFVYPQLGRGQLLRGNQIKLPQWGGLEYVKSRDIPEGFVVKQARIVRKASGYFVMLTLECDVFVPEIMPHGHPVGIDLGQDLFVAKSEGDGLTGTGNHLVKNPGSRNKGGEVRIQPAS